MTTSATNAATITAPQVLELLDGRFARTAGAIADGLYAFWLGSGISRNRVDDLKSLVRRALQHLSSQITPSAPQYAAALEDALSLADLTPAQKTSLDLKRDPSTWPTIGEIENRLAQKYSMFLDIRLDGHPKDYLLWDAGEAAQTFGATSDPDCEHLCLAILAAEGVIPEIVCANWDGLIESAVQRIGAPANTLKVCVRAVDLCGPRPRCRLLKFHGCAVRALSNPAEYRPLLVARQSQITQWKISAEHAAMKAELEHLATTMNTLMVGLSAQDSNVQEVFNEARARTHWAWPCDPPAFVFAEDAIGPSQKQVLACGYRDSYDQNPRDAETGSLLRAFGKPLFLSLVLHVWCSKLQACMEAAASHLDPGERAELRDGIRVLRDAVAMVAEPHASDFVLALCRSMACVLTLFRQGRFDNNPAYHPVTPGPAATMLADEGFRHTSGMPEAALAIALLGDGQHSAAWTVRVGDPTDPASGALSIASRGGFKSRVFLVAHESTYVALLRSGVVDETASDVVVFQSSTVTSTRVRAPKAPPGRTGRAKLRRVAMPALTASTPTLLELRTRFRQGAAL